ncbi:unnamed protein product [Blepharisma stoltei]|uniref:Uncharacterized protein n=1 Tax=Blepharisma stoltei TaxID=1481888 RepID=A0AAU9IDQ5_9CILI|nr:unnamed protein product [Blepharisma stoltei]
MDFGKGITNKTATEYLNEELLPALNFAFTDLLEHVIKVHEIDKWKEMKEEEYHKYRREARKREKENAGESVTESEEWVDSELSSTEEKEVPPPPFNPLLFVADKLMEWKKIQAEKNS